MITSSVTGQFGTKPLSVTKSEYRPNCRADVFTLPDQRRLGYTEFGSSQGRPVLYFHDAGSSRLEASLFAVSAKKSDIRLIACDRPGIGLSTAHRGGNAVSMAADIIALIDHLRLEKTDLLALGSGGVHALTLSRYYPDRVGTQALVGGVSGSVFNEVPARTVLTRCWSGLTPSMIRLAVRMKHRLFPEAAEQNIQRLLTRLSFTDRKLLSDPDVIGCLITDQQEALRQGLAGVVEDFALAHSKLGFSLTEVKVSSVIWQGAADRLAESASCQFMASRLPNAQLNRIAHAGHFFFLNRMDQVLATLAPESRARMNALAA